MEKPKVIAFYLPQYHPTPDNDKWWGKGFTEWTNVGKAKPLFKGHYQPKVPADLGYYDLRLPEVREAQAELAKEAGIYGFCYYHYWFGDGKKELELPFKEVLRTGNPDFPFMLCWANTSWHKKFWNKDGEGSSKEILIEQKYLGDQDIKDHFFNLLPAFKDSRYIKIDGRPLFMIYVPFEYQEVKRFIQIWNDLALQNELKEFLFICQVRIDAERKKYKDLLNDGFTYINTERLRDAWHLNSLTNRLKRKLLRDPFGIFVNKINYNEARKKFLVKEDKEKFIIPTLIPNWDHTPRSKKGGFVFTESTPTNFYEHCIEIFSFYPDKPFYFLKSWNEWGEGNYMEPDLKYGKGYIEALAKAIKKIIQLK